MSVHPDDPQVQYEQVQLALAEARRDFAADVDALLSEIQPFARALGRAIGDIDANAAVFALRRFILERFDRRLRLRPPRVDQLQQLVVEALDHLTNPDSTVDLRDWITSAQRALRG